MHSHYGVLYNLYTLELLKEIEMDGERVAELLKECSDYLEDDYLDRCLLAATRNGNILNMIKIIIKGAANFDECLKVAQELNKPKAIAQLLLNLAANQGNRDLLLDLLSDPLACTEHSYKQFMTPEVRKSAWSKEVSMVTPMRIARRQQHFLIQQDLMMKIGVDMKTSTILWHELRLSSLELSWLQSITWAKTLRLDRNVLGALPASIGFYLRAVIMFAYCFIYPTE